jgi:quercetin dioxygenase-like cupin family protein
VGLNVEPVPRWDWMLPPPGSGHRGVDARVLFREPAGSEEPDFFVSMLRFGRGAAIQEHADERGGTHEVICLEGSGFTSLGGEKAPIRAGQRVTWPPSIVHGLWTEDDEMVTLMVGRYSAAFGD